jgi:hypothetical protein
MRRRRVERRRLLRVRKSFVILEKIGLILRRPEGPSRRKRPLPLPVANLSG